MKARSLFLVTIFISACSYSTLVPVNYDIHDPDGEVFLQEKDGVTAILQNLQIKDGLLVFDHMIINRTEEMIEIDPDRIHFYAGNRKFPKIKADSMMVHDLSYPYSLLPHRSEGALSEQEVDRHYKEKLAERTALAAFFLVAVVVVVAVDATQDAKDQADQNDESASKRHRSYSRAVARDAMTDLAVWSADIATDATFQANVSTAEDRAFVSEEILQAGVIFPEEFARGKVFLKRHGDFKYYRLVVPVEIICLSSISERGNPEWSDQSSASRTRAAS